jgi:hypothetical protein
MSQRHFLFEDPQKYSEVCRAEYEAGDKLALGRLLMMCATCRWQIPEWAGEILIGAQMAASYGELGTWDEVFGKLARNQRKKVRAWQSRRDIYAKVLHYHDLGEPIDDLLFEKVGDMYGIGKTKTKEIYGYMRDMWARRAAGEDVVI